MLIIPAIDLRGGRVVRLSEGDYQRETVYGEDPVSVAESFRDAGATQLHVVDLDAARDGSQANLSIIRNLLRVGLCTEVGGGCRDEASVRRYLDAGASRCVIGSAAFTKPGFLSHMASAYPGRIVAGVDARNGYAYIHGWRERTDIRAMDFLRALPDMGVEMAVYTDISRDGLLEGTNLDAYRETRDIARLRVVASGGVTDDADILALRDMGLYAAIVGRALYAGRIDLAHAIRLAETGECHAE